MKKLIPNPDTLLTTQDNEGVFLNLSSEKYYTLNETGVCVYNAIVEGKSDEEIVDLVIKRYEVDYETARKDYTSIKHDLIQSSILMEASEK